MPKTDVKKIESEDVKELSDEALDRAAEIELATACLVFPFQIATTVTNQH